MIITYYIITTRMNPREKLPHWTLIQQVITDEDVNNTLVETGLTLPDATAMLIGLREQQQGGKEHGRNH